MGALAFLIIKPFITAILTSIIIAIMMFPLYELLNKKLKKPNLSALLITILIILLIVTPILLVLQLITKETYTLYLLSKQKIISGEVLNVDCTEPSIICQAQTTIKKVISDPKINYQLQKGIESGTSFIIDQIGDFILSIPVFILNFFIMIFIVFFLIRDGKRIANKVKKLLPLKKHYQKSIFQKSKEVTFAVVYGHLFVAMIQGTLGGIGFMIFKVPSPLLWGLIMGFAALIPFVGTPIIWFPVAAYRIIIGFSTGNNPLFINGILLFLYGALIVSTIDNFLKPKIIGNKAEVHPILVLLGVLGGLKFFGLIGIIIGPVILAIFNMIIKIYEEERGPVKSEAKS